MFGTNFKNLPDFKIFNDSSKKLDILEFRNCGIEGNIPTNKYLVKNARFDISGNNMNGAIDNSWCNGVDFTITDNNFSGALPFCFYCYLGIPSFYNKFSGNSFDNFNTLGTNCNYSSKPNIASTPFTIWGENLGYDISNMKLTPSANFWGYTSYGNLLSGSFSGAPSKFNLTIVSLDLTYTLSLSITQPPIINQIIQKNDTLSFIGEYFTYNSSDTTIIIDNYQKCHIENTTFYQVDCVLDKQLRDRGFRPITAIVKKSFNNDLQTLNTSKTDFKLEYIVYSCGDCGNGYCNTVNATCICNEDWVTIEGYPTCMVPNHYISSTSQVPSKTGGEITLYGWFGTLHDHITVTVGNSVCDIISYDNTTIVCTAKPGSGSQKITVTQNKLEFHGKFYPFIGELLCPNNCTSPEHGTCIFGQCSCKKNYVGLDCGGDTSLNSTIESGSINFSSQASNFLISIDSINEVDIMDRVVDVWNLTNKWVPLVDSELSNKYTSVYSQSRQNSNATITLIIEQVPNSKDFSFAGVNFTINSGGTKFSIDIKEWTYKSNLNTLQLQISTTTEFKNKDPCISHDESTHSSSSNDQMLDSVNYLKVIKDSKTLYGRFLDRMLSDGRETTIETKIKSNSTSNIILTINLPHCKECILDPGMYYKEMIFFFFFQILIVFFFLDFSVLIDPNYINNNKNTCSNKKNWVIIVAVVVPVVVVSIVLVVVVVLYKKNTINIRIGLRNVSMRSLKDRSRN
ncbi:hypothetical protein DICPUDRAFT_42576 [Dictyostelium purpureum]|uniref:Uncharacterized protein n=1 Tax=Dictyostelium purpureum TaxID=5786 RepID=F1A2E8_DICPU|nr:uncharacterized protein DICPUDRAFT_42576 [Dictyostelium purpureum]EGC29638.1 hypothetical protein DICPUDRAFT_42576 [Dictyostelium purpureum]|eukprot:XP_003293842.1 hypothetical protein DICPUDRAFT_42576 [Dictyostelium purpureum]